MGTEDDKEDHDHDHALELLPVKNTRDPSSNSSDDQKKNNKEQGVDVDLNEYYQQQRDHDHKRKEGEKRNEAQHQLHQFHGVAESSSLLVQEDHDEQILSAGTNSNAQFETGDSPMNINIGINVDIGNNINTRVVRVRDKKQNENIQADPALSFQWISTLIASSTTATILNELIRQRSLTSLPLVYHQNTKQNNVLQSLMSAVLMRSYKPSLFIGTRSVLNSTYGYMKPLLGQGSRSGPQHGFFRERMKCSRDGAMIGLDWQLPHKVMNTGTCSQSQSESQRKDQQDYVKHGPIQESIVLILHGVNTDTSFGYMRSMMNACADNGWIAVGMNARGCGGVDLNTPRFGTAAYTNDLRHVVEVLCSRLASTAKLFLVGFSLGANTLVKYLGETGLAGHDKLPKNVAGAVSLCNPMRINHARLESPWSQILTLGAKKHFFQHRRSVNQMTCDNYQKAIQHATLYSKNLAEMAESAKPYMIRNSIRYPFENSLGYQSKEEYWNEASSQNYIAHISVPILVCFAGDDKIACQNTLAIMNSCLSNPNVILVQTPCGGHIGWHTSTHGNFVDRTAVKFISAVLRREHWDMVAESRMEAARRSRNLANGLQSKL